jgi:hypothetical protein
LGTIPYSLWNAIVAGRTTDSRRSHARHFIAGARSPS